MSKQPNDTNFIERAKGVPLGKAIQVVAFYNYMLAVGFFIVNIDTEAIFLLTILGTTAWILGSILQ